MRLLGLTWAGETAPRRHGGDEVRPQSRRESEWLLGLLRDPPDGALSERLAHLTEAEWDRLATEALRHFAAPLLYHRLRRFAPALPAVPGIEALRHEYVQNALRNIRTYAALGEVVRAFEAARIPVIALKGAHLAAVVYGEPALRPMHDLDLLVPRQDRSRAEDRLLQLGYRPMECAREWTDYDTHHHSRPLFRDGATTVEIHSAIVPPTCPIRIDLEGLWDRARHAQLGDIRTLVLAPEDLILHLCLHASYSHHFRIPLLSLYDLAAVLRHHSREIDWPRLVSVANESGTGPLVYCTLRLVQATLGAELDAPSFESFAQHGTDEVVTEAILDEILSTPVEVPTGVRRVVGQERWNRKLHILLQTIFPPRDQLRAIYNLRSDSRLLSWWYLLRPLDLLARRGRTLAALAFRSHRSPHPVLEAIRRRDIITRWLNEAAIDRHKAPGS